MLLDRPHPRGAADDEVREEDGERQQPGDAADDGALDRIGAGLAGPDYFSTRPREYNTGTSSALDAPAVRYFRR
jgi:hypothetical protein